MDVPKEGIIVHLKDLGQACKDRDADAVGTAFDLRVDAPGDVQIHKLQFGNHLVLRQLPLHTQRADGFANLNILFQFLFHDKSLLFRASGSIPKPILWICNVYIAVSLILLDIPSIIAMYSLQNRRGLGPAVSSVSLPGRLWRAAPGLFRWFCYPGS